jgi:hypothetical protein
VSIVAVMLGVGLLVAWFAFSDRGKRDGVRLGTVWANAQHGYGEVEPSYISNGGEPTGIVEDVRWTGWGEEVAIGSGYSYVPHESVADSTREPVEVIAFDLGVCEGENAYQAVDWYSPQLGEEFDPVQYYDICTVDDAG